MDANTRKMIEVLKRGEEIEYGFLGVTVNPEDRSDGRRGHDPGGRRRPAGRPGRAVGRDVVTAINGNPVREQDDLFLHIAAALAGIRSERSRSRRNGRPMDVRAPAGQDAPRSATVIASNRPKPVHGLRVDYASTLSLDANPPEGVLVKEVESGSPAAKKLRGGPAGAQLIVTAVDGQPVPTPADFYRLAGGRRRSHWTSSRSGPRPLPRKVTLP